jgi:hypothetical protein
MRCQVNNNNKVVATAKKQRVTVEYKPCKKYWYYNWKLIVGCTTSIDPDGLDTGKEWCQIK